MYYSKSIARDLTFTGWLSIAFWQAVVAGSGFLCGTFIQGLMVLNNPTSYTFKRWHGTLLFWATILLALFVNTLLARWLPKIEGFILALHVLGFFAIIFPLVYLSDHASASEVFTQFLNEGNLPTQGISFLVGMISGVGTFVGKFYIQLPVSQAEISSSSRCRWLCAHVRRNP